MKEFAQNILALIFVVGTFAAYAQEAPKVTDQPKSVPTISKQDSDAVLQMQSDVVALRKAITILQRELDASTAEFIRTMQRLQQPGYEIVTGPSGLVYVAVPKAAPEVKK